MDNLKNTNITISSGTMIKGILLVLLVAALFFLKDLVLVVLTAIVIATAIEPITKWFNVYKIPRTIAVLLIYIITILLFLGVFYLFIPPLLEEVSGLLASLPQYGEFINISSSSGINTFISSQTFDIGNISLSDVVSNFRSSFTDVSGGFVKTISAVFGGVLSFVLIIVFSFYFAVKETGVDDFLRVISPVKHQRYILDLWRRSQVKIGRWMQGQLVLAFIIGVLVYLGLTILDVRYALLLAVLAAMFELIPVFGPILAAVPGVAIAFIDGGTSLGLLVLGLYLIIQQFENHLIYPLVVTKVVGVPPLLVILALIIGYEFAGFLGIILSVPIAAIVQELVKDIQASKEIFIKKHPEEVS